MTSSNDESSRAAQLPMDSAAGGSFGVAAPVGAVSVKDRERAARTALTREGPTALVLRTALPGTVRLQRRGDDGAWETLVERAAARLGRTRLELPGTSDDERTYRVVFAPRNGFLPAWTSPELDR